MPVQPSTAIAPNIHHLAFLSSGLFAAAVKPQDEGEQHEARHEDIWIEDEEGLQKADMVRSRRRHAGCCPRRFVLEWNGT